MKRIIATVLALCLFCNVSGLAVVADSANYGFTFEDTDSEMQAGVSFTFEDGTLTFFGEGDMPEPDYFEDPEWAVYADQTEVIVIQSGVTSIGMSAFCDFVLVEDVVIAETVTKIGINAFAGCNALSEIYIPKSVERFVQSPFVNCLSLENIIVDPENPYFCSVDGVLFNKDKSVLWAYPIGNGESAYIIPDEVETIEAYAFSQADTLTAVTFNDNLKRIGDEAFLGSGLLNNVCLPEGLVFIGGGVFQDCLSLTEISLPSTIEIIRPLAFYNTAYYNDLANWELGLLYIGEYLLTGEYCISGEDWRVEEYQYVSGKVTIKDGTRLIAGSAFSWFNWDPDITEVDFPTSLQFINEGAFSFCEKMTSVCFTESILHIDECAFMYCTGINEIRLPDSVTHIGDSAFAECSNLSYVNLGEGLVSIGTEAFDGTEYFSNTYNYADGYLYNGKYLLGCLKNEVESPIEINIGTEVIADGALSKIGTWEAFSVSIPDSLKHIGKEAFLGTNTGEITLPNTVLSIGDYAIGFTSKEYDDSNSEYVYSKTQDAAIVGHSDSVAGDYAKKFGITFYDYTDYQEGDYTYRISNWECIITDFNAEYAGELVIPDTIGGFTVTGIDRSAFEDCKNITKVTIPNAVDYIGNFAFSGCENIVLCCQCGSYAIRYASDNFIEIVSPDCVWSDATCEQPKKCQVCGANNGFGLGHDMVFGDDYDYCQREDCNHIVNHVDQRPIQDNFKYGVTEGRAHISKYIGTSPNAFIPRKCGIYTAVEIGRFTFEDTPFVKTITFHNSINYIDSWAFSGCTELTDVYFTGTEEEWGKIYISRTGNEALFAARIHYEKSFLDTVCTEHVFDNDCDAECNKCGNTRATEHKYDNACDTTCNKCGETREVLVIVPDENTTVTINEEGFSEIVFVPAATGKYAFYSMSDQDTYGKIFDARNNELYSNDDGGENGNFRIVAELIEGETYILRAEFLSGNITGSFTVRVDTIRTDGYYTYEVSGGNATIIGVDESISGDVVIPSALGGYPVVAIGNSAFAWCSDITAVTIPNSVTIIGDDAFLNCSGLTEIEFGTGVARVNGYAFYGCRSLTEVTLNDTTTVLGEYAFGNCYELKTITLGASVNCIADRAFTGSSALMDIIVHKDNTEFCAVDGILFSEDKAKLVFYPEAKSGVYTIPAGVTEIGRYAFYNHSDLTSVTIGDDVTEICESAFSNTGLTNVTIGNSVTTIGPSAFSSCLSLKEVTLGNKVATICDCAFWGCEALETVKLPRSVTNIGFQAFEECGSLSHVWYEGSQTDRDNIAVDSYNRYLTNAAWHYNKCFNHVYDSACDSQCDNCDATRVVPDHVYSNACDKTCNECGATRTVPAHKYSNACDKTCNVCGATRSITHKYTNACDKSCNVCGTTRTVPAHKYTNNCDTTCNVCNAKRTIKHTYTNACDKSCNVCGATRTVPAHKYTNNCDTTCNVCNAKRTIKHTYSNSCDTSCNVCKATRSITHSYKTTTTKATLTKSGSIVKKCSVCGKVASNTAIKYPKTFTLSATSYTYNGAVKKPTVTVKDSAGKTISSSNYTVTYASGRKSAGTYTVKVTMKGNYTGTKTLSFKINPINVSKCKLSLSTTAYTYDGKVKKPAVTVKTASGTKLTTSSYTVTYASGRKNVGTYKVTATRTSDYAGTKTLTFKINPAKTTVSKVTPATKSLKVSITKKSTQVTGYQIQYSTPKSFTSPKTKTITSYKTTTTTLSSLKTKTTYYVRVRTYKTVSGVKYYSGWSTVKSAKTK